MFQSLIGRLKTLLSLPHLAYARWFQSLIGRLKTFWLHVRCQVGDVFQSLIGRLKTSRKSSAGSKQKIVSIPYR